MKPRYHLLDGLPTWSPSLALMPIPLRPHLQQRPTPPPSPRNLLTTLIPLLPLPTSVGLALTSLKPPNPSSTNSLPSVTASDTPPSLASNLVHMLRFSRKQPIPQ